MQILNTGIVVAGATNFQGSTQKEVGKLIIYTDVEFDALTTEKIHVFVERSQGQNSSITKLPILLKPFIMACTHNDPAIGAFHNNHYEPWNTVAVIDLTVQGNIELLGNDNLTVVLEECVVGKKYLVDGIPLEDSNPDQTDIYEYEEKHVPDEQTDYSISIDNYDVCVIEDSHEIVELNRRFDNGYVQKLTMRELRALSINHDPVQYIDSNGKTYTAFSEYLAFDCSDLTDLNIIKRGNAQVNVLFRHNVQIKQMVSAQNAVKAQIKKAQTLV